MPGSATAGEWQMADRKGPRLPSSCDCRILLAAHAIEVANPLARCGQRPSLRLRTSQISLERGCSFAPAATIRSSFTPRSSS